MSIIDVTIDRNLIQTEKAMLEQWGDFDKPLVSITCITYNHEKYISAAIDGFLIQKTDFPFEILVHDDASTDRTADIIREYEKRYPKIIKPIYQKENQYSQGKNPDAFNDKRALGEYIAMCEGDDYWIDPLKLMKSFNAMVNNDVNLVVHTAIKMNSKTKALTLFGKHEDKDCLINGLDAFKQPGQFSPTSSYFLRADVNNEVNKFLKAHKPSFTDFFTEVISSEKKIYFISKPMSVYRVSIKDSYSSKTSQLSAENLLDRFHANIHTTKSLNRYGWITTELIEKRISLLRTSLLRQLFNINACKEMRRILHEGEWVPDSALEKVKISIASKSHILCYILRIYIHLKKKLTSFIGSLVQLNR